MTLSHKDWELPNSQIWLAENDIDHGLDFPILPGNVLQWKSCKLKCNIIDFFHATRFNSVSAKKLIRKKSKEDELTLEELN